MATSSTTPVWLNTSDATFRVWGKAISDALAAVGLTQTSDTGQIDWATVTRSASVSVDNGYEIWRFNDSAQSAAPIFMKVRYGNHSTVTNPRLQIDFGQGSDGAGNLTGVIQTSAFAPSNQTVAGVAAPLYISYSSAAAALSIAASATTATGWRFTVERAKNLDGTPRSDVYFLQNYATTASGATHYMHRVTPGIWVSHAGTQPHIVSTVGNIAATGSAGGKAAAGGWVPWSGISPAIHGPLERTLGVMAVRQADFYVGQTFTCTRWDGVSHTYLVVPSVYGGLEQTSTIQYTAILWE